MAGKYSTKKRPEKVHQGKVQELIIKCEAQMKLKYFIIHERLLFQENQSGNFLQHIQINCSDQIEFYQ